MKRLVFFCFIAIDNGSDNSNEALSDIVDLVTLENGKCFSMTLVEGAIGRSSGKTLFIANSIKVVLPNA